jgi:uncharacterized protein YaaW (UPF0174 family)
MTECETIDQIVSENDARGIPRAARQHAATCHRCRRFYGALIAPNEAEAAFQYEAADRLEAFVAKLIRGDGGRTETSADEQRVLTQRRPRLSKVGEVPNRLLTEPVPDRPGRRSLELAEIEGWIRELEAIPPASKWNPDEILETAEPAQVESLCQALGLSTASTPSAAEIAETIGRQAGHGVANVVRSLWYRRKIGSVGVHYAEVVRDVASLEKVPVQYRDSASEIEQKIVQHRFLSVWEQLDPAKREELLGRFDQEAARQGRSFRAEAGIAGTLALANVSGFGVYMLASSLVGSLSSALGVGLSFGFYTAMSQLIATAIPGGLAAVGAFTLYKVQAPNKQKAMAAVLHIAAMRLYIQDLLTARLADLRARKIDLQEQESKGAGDRSSVAATLWSKRRWIATLVIVAVLTAVAVFWMTQGS